MYDKPDDIPQWAWDMAVEAADAASGPMGAIWGHEQGAPAIAKFIIQARSQAFEESAKIAEAFGAPRTSRPPAGEFQGIRETVWEGMDELRRSQAQSISQAIRQHSQKGRDTE